MQLSMFSSEEPPAKASQSLDSEEAWMTAVATSCSPMLQLLTDIGPSGWFGKTSPESFQAPAEPTLQAYWLSSLAGQSSHQPAGGATAESYRASKGLTASHGECLTLNTSEYPSAAVVCSLSDVLEGGNVPQRFFLSAKACSGILRRAEKRGKKLPEQLRVALEAVAIQTPVTGTEEE